jgi:predicted protein tyrosine phosphatase
MFELTISDLETSEVVIRKWATKAIGLMDPKLQGIIPQKENYLQLFFHDCDEAFHPDYEAVSPERHHIEEALDFSSGFHDKDKVLVHCHAGVSRSVAVAIAIYVQHGLEPFEAFERVSRSCRIMYPNKLILKHADDILGLAGRLTLYHELWLMNFHPDRDYLRS